MPGGEKLSAVISMDLTMACSTKDELTPLPFRMTGPEILYALPYPQDKIFILVLL